jgi:hypothetical protein
MEHAVLYVLQAVVKLFIKLFLRGLHLQEHAHHMSAGINKQFITYMLTVTLHKNDSTRTREGLLLDHKIQKQTRNRPHPESCPIDLRLSIYTYIYIYIYIWIYENIIYIFVCS